MFADRFWSGNICDRSFFEPDRLRASRALYFEREDWRGGIIIAPQSPSLNLDRFFSATVYRKSRWECYPSTAFASSGSVRVAPTITRVRRDGGNTLRGLRNVSIVNQRNRGGKMKTFSLLSPFTSSQYRKFDNTRRLARVLYRFKLYGKQFIASHGKVPVTELIRTQFPFLLSDALAPPKLSVELTNYCNLACPYCSSPLKLRPQGLMDPITFSNLVRQAKECRIPWISLCGMENPLCTQNLQAMCVNSEPQQNFSN